MYMDNLVIYQHYDVLQTDLLSTNTSVNTYITFIEVSLKFTTEYRVPIDVFQSKYVSVFDTKRLLWWWRKNIKHLSTKWNQLENKTDKETDESAKLTLKPQHHMLLTAFWY